VTLDAICVVACVSAVTHCSWHPRICESSWVPRMCVCNGYVTHEAAKSNLGCVVEFDLSLADGGVTSAVSKGNLGKGSCCYPLEYRRPQ